MIQTQAAVPERVTVPAGAFDTIKIDIRVDWTDSGESGFYSWPMWFARGLPFSAS